MSQLYCLPKGRLPFVLYLLLFVFYFGCAERRADNPFDPNSTLPPPVDVRLTPHDDYVDLRWSLRQEVTDFDGFRVYRAVDSLSSLRVLAELPTTEFTFRDSLLENNRQYFYRISIIGQGVESALSPVRQTIIGPGDYWLLSRNGYCVKKLSYDLRYQQEDFPTIWRPLTWTGDAGDSLIWYIFGDFENGISQFNRADGSEDVYFFTDGVKPVDITHRSRDKSLFVLDGEGHRILIVRNKQIVTEQALDTLAGFRRVIYDSLHAQLLILGTREVVFWPVELDFANATRHILPTDWETTDIDLVGLRTYLATTSTTGISQILTLETDGGSPLDTLQTTGEIYRIRYDWVNDWFYAAEAVSGDDHILQLSADGSRLFQVDGFNYIEQIAINPFNRSVVIVDSGNSSVSLIDKDGRSISSTGDAGNNLLIYSPIRILIE